jgi:hypothetical protein
MLMAELNSDIAETLKCEGALIGTKRFDVQFSIYINLRLDNQVKTFSILDLSNTNCKTFTLTWVKYAEK